VHQHGDAQVMAAVTKIAPVSAGMAGEAAVGLVVLIVGIWMVKRWNKPPVDIVATGTPVLEGSAALSGASQT
jgi:hypothetical protein